MLIACSAVALLIAGFALYWTLKGFVVAPTSAPVEVDIAAFRNALSLDDTRDLRERLTEAQYRLVKRARVRAVQEYLKAIARNCAVTIAVLRAKAAEDDETRHPEISSLANDALRIRLLCLGFWLALWAEFIFPNLETHPVQIAGSYERLCTAAELWLRSSQARSKVLAES